MVFLVDMRLSLVIIGLFDKLHGLILLIFADVIVLSWSQFFIFFINYAVPDLSSKFL